MRHKLITALLASITAGAASAQVAGSSGGDTNAPQSNPATVEVAGSDGNVTNIFQPGPAIIETSLFGLGPMTAVDVEEGWSFVDPDATQIQGDLLLQKFDLLHADSHGPPVYFGRDKEVKFVEKHDNRPGIPAPVGMSYPIRPRRLEFFGEIAPILDAAPANSLGWGGGLGIRFYIGH